MLSETLRLAGQTVSIDGPKGVQGTKLRRGDLTMADTTQGFFGKNSGRPPQRPHGTAGAPPRGGPGHAEPAQFRDS
jgi:hypothetical protein